jgi:hypothetical protein
VAAIILWNTVYLSRAIQGLKAHGLSVGDNLLEHLPPLGWEHINLTGDYVWRQNRRVESGYSDPSDPFSFLNVRFFPFREVGRALAIFAVAQLLAAAIAVRLFRSEKTVSQKQWAIFSEMAFQMKLTTRKGLHIGQLAKLAGVRSDTVCFYEQSGLLARPERSPAGYRIYDEAR